MTSLRINRFGGLKPIASERNLSDHMATIAKDVDLSQGILKPWRTPRDLGAFSGKHLWREDCCTKAFEDCYASVAYKRIDCKRIIATNVGYPYPVTGTLEEWCAGDVCRLGFPCDLPAPTTSTPANSGFSEYKTDKQFRHYAYRLINKYGEISNISDPSLHINVDALDNVTISLPAGFTSYCITSIEILRSEQMPDFSGNTANSMYFRIGEVPIGTTSFVDIGEIIQEIADETMDYAPPPDDLRSVQYWGNDQFVGLSENRLAVSEKGEYSAWPYANYISFDDIPVEILATESVCYVATDARPVIVSINVVDGCRAVNRLDDSHPIVSKRSMVAYNNHTLYASKDGIVMLSPSGQAKILTANYYTKDQWRALQPATMHAVVHDGHYFGFFENETIRFKIHDGVYEDTTDVGLTTLTMRPTAAYRALNDELYYLEGGKLWWWNEGDSWLELEWQSGTFDMPSIIDFSAFKLLISQDIATIEHWVDQERIDLDLILDANPKHLPSGRDGLDWSINIKTKGIVKEYSLATSINDLGMK
jgi:hypothetical protein